MFLVMPSIDVECGRAVKRVRGVRGSGLVLGNPVDVARRFAEAGAEWIHVVDLDGAEAGAPVNLPLVTELRRLGLRIQFGGGVRSPEAAEAAVAAGADRVVVGSAWIDSPALLKEIADRVGGERVVAALDVDEEGAVLYRGWRARKRIPLPEAIRVIESAGVWGILYTQAWIEGTMSGIDRGRALAVRRATRLPIIFAGGVAGVSDVAWLCRSGFQGVVLGMALYAGRVRLEEVLGLARKECGGGEVYG